MARSITSDDAGGGRYCREYRGRAVIAGHARRVHGTVCRRPDGSRQVIN